jgi:hypothetical protein
MRILKSILRISVVAFSIVYMASIIGAQSVCPFASCRGPDGDVWALPLFLSLPGIPACFLSTMFAAQGISPKSRAVVFLKYLALATAILPVAGVALAGAIAGMHVARPPS